MRQYFVNRFFVSESAINQNASINKNSKSSNSRNLKQHTIAKSISFCCFCFCSAREIDRFIILICRYLSHRSRSRFSTKFSTKFWTRFSFSSHIYIFLLLAHFLLSIYLFTFIASAMKFSTSIMIRQIFELQSMNFFAMSIDRKNE